MSRPLALTQRQVRALCAGAKKEGYAPIVEIGNVSIKLVPEEHVIPPPAKPKRKYVDNGRDFEL